MRVDFSRSARVHHARHLEWAAYLGDEQLMSNGEPLEKCYWNRAIGLDRAALRGRNSSPPARPVR